jgi:predicted GIY-YIG superfamily endonuclease
MYTVYWIKSSEHQDPFKEGYIGITSKQVEERFKEHKHNNKNKHLKNLCRKEDVEIIKLVENLDENEAKKIETEYRPDENIGWNINKGGDIPPSRKGKISPKSLLVGDNRTEKQKQGSKKRSEKIKGNNFSGQRKNKVDHSRYCVNCEKYFNPGYNIHQKYCSRKCAGSTNLNPNKKALLAEATKLSWANKTRSDLIKKMKKVNGEQ